MPIKSLMLKVGNDNFEIDENISCQYIIGLCWKYSWMVICRRLVSVVYKLYLTTSL